MKPKIITDPAETASIIERFKNRSTETNCYLMPDELQRLAESGLLQTYIDGNNAFLLENKGNCYRIHYLINDLRKGVNIESDKPLMLEILFRGIDGEPSSATAYWEHEGFRRNLVRRNLSAKISDLIESALLEKTTIDVSIASTDQEAQFARQLFNSSFDPYSGDYITTSDIDNILKNRQLLVAYIQGQPVGALNFYISGRCIWLGHVAVVPVARGHRVGVALVSDYIRRNHTDEKSRYSLWVQEQNIAATKMYDRFGFKYAGKSSLSMIKD